MRADVRYHPRAAPIIWPSQTVATRLAPLRPWRSWVRPQVPMASVASPT